MGIIKGGIEFTGPVGNLVAYKRNGKIVVQTKGGATKKKIYTDPAMAGTKNNSFAFRNAVTVGVNLRKGIDFSNCAPMSIHSKLQGFLFGKVVRNDTVNPPGEWRVLRTNLPVLNTFRFNDLIPSAIEYDMLNAVWSKTETGIRMKLEIPNFDSLKSNFNGFKIWGGVRLISLIERNIFDSCDVISDLYDAGSTGEVVFDFPELKMTDAHGELHNEEDVAVVYHWGFSTFIDGYVLYNKAMNGVFMRVGDF